MLNEYVKVVDDSDSINLEEIKAEINSFVPEGESREGFGCH